MLIDTIQDLNDEIKILLTNTLDRTRWLLSALFDYCITNPNSTPASAQAALVTAYNAQWPLAIVNIDPALFLTAFLNRHGQGVNVSEKYAFIKQWVVMHRDLKKSFLNCFEEGVLKPIPDLWQEQLEGSLLKGIAQPSDVEVIEIRDTSPGPTFNFIIERQLRSVSRGITIRKRFINTFDGQRVIISEGPLEKV